MIFHQETTRPTLEKKQMLKYKILQKPKRDIRFWSNYRFEHFAKIYPNRELKSLLMRFISYLTCLPEKYRYKGTFSKYLLIL